MCHHLKSSLQACWVKYMRRIEMSPWAPPPRSSAATLSAPCVSSVSPALTPSLVSPPPPCTASPPCCEYLMRQIWNWKKTTTLLCVQDLGERVRTDTYLSISTSVRSSATQLWCDWSMERRVWPQPFGHSLLRKLHSDRWASKPRLSTCTGQPEWTEMARPHMKQPCTLFTCLKL